MTAADPSSHLRALVQPAERPRLRKPRSVQLTIDLSLIWLQILGSWALYLVYPSFGTWLVGFFLVGGAVHGLAMATHEFAHRLVVPENRRLNDLLGTWLFAAPAGLPFQTYRRRHNDHHRLASTEADTKRMYRRSFRGWSFVWEIARALSGADYFAQVLRVLTAVRRGDTAPRGLPPPLKGMQRDGFVVDALPVVTVHLVLAVVLVIIDPVLWIGLWIGPFLTSAVLFSKLRSAVEHLPTTDRSQPGARSAYYGNTPESFTRSVRASWWEPLFFSRLNFHFHAEHHLWPAVSYQFLPLLHQRLVDADRFDDPSIDVKPTYASTLRLLSRACVVPADEADAVKPLTHREPAAGSPDEA